MLRVTGGCLWRGGGILGLRGAAFYERGDAANEFVLEGRPHVAPVAGGWASNARLLECVRVKFKAAWCCVSVTSCTIAAKQREWNFVRNRTDFSDK